MQVLPTAFYFLFGFVVFRYQLLFVHSPQYQTNGTLWLHLSHCCLASLLLAQAVLCSILAVRRAPKEACALAPLAVGTVAFYRFLQSTYADAFTSVPRDVAEQADKRHRVLDPVTGQLPFPFPQARVRLGRVGCGCRWGVHWVLLGVRLPNVAPTRVISPLHHAR